MSTTTPQMRPNRNQMIEIIQKNVKPVLATETISYLESFGRISATEILANNTLPNTPVSRLDGIAIRFDDVSTDPTTWVEGDHYAYCNTGVAMPEGYDTVIPIENVTYLEKGLSLIDLPTSRGERVGKVGNNMVSGEVIVRKNDVISPAQVGLLASAGVLSLDVYTIPRIGIMPTGDELIPPTVSVPLGKNIESNSAMIAAYIKKYGALATIYPITQDDPQTIEAHLADALRENDAVLILAGSSLGTKDYTLRILEKIGDVIVTELAHGPGRKSSLSIIDEKIVMGVAGPPLGAQLTCDLYLPVLVNALKGLPYEALREIEVVCDDPFASHSVDFCERVHIYNDKGTYHIRSAYAPTTTRAQMEAIANGNFYRPARTPLAIGDKTKVELLIPIEQVPTRDRLDELLNPLEAVHD